MIGAMGHSDKNSPRSETDIDRALEAIARKRIDGSAQKADLAAYDELSASRFRRLMRAEIVPRKHRIRLRAKKQMGHIVEEPSAKKVL